MGIGFVVWMLGAGDADGAFAASARMIALTVYLGVAFAALMLVFEGYLPRIFTGDDAVIAEAHELWCALLALICVRLTTLAVRFTRRRWLVTGWA